MSLVIHCADIGSVRRNNFGWARLTVGEAQLPCETGDDICLFADGIAADINAGHRVALGFECPLFVPVSVDPTELTAARPGEGDRAWSAGAGAGSLATGLSETVWILDRVRRQLTTTCHVQSNWELFQSTGGLFIWEAFVTKAAKADTHHGDAELAVLSFRDSLPNPEKHTAIASIDRIRSLFGAALLQTGWVTDLKWLTEACVVTRVLPKAQL